MSKKEKLKEILDKRGYYNTDIESEILDLFNPNNNDSTSPTVYTEWNRIIQEIADEKCMSIDNRILRHLKTKYHPPIKRSSR